MAPEKWRLPVVALSALALVSCSEVGTIPNPLDMGKGGIHVDSHAKPGNSLLLRSGQPVVLLLGPVADKRPGAPARKVGEIHSTVIDLADTSLTLDQDVSAAVFDALRNQLAADGFRAAGDLHAAHDFAVDVAVTDFRLDVVDQDRLSIAADFSLRDAKSGDVLWAGSVAEKSSRFAGIAGNSRASIVAYFTKGLNAWAVKASAAISDALLKSFPQTMAVSERRELAPPQRGGVTTQQEAKPREAESANPVPPVAPIAVAVAATPGGTAVDAAASATGTFSLVTVPAKAKVYIEDVYYGSSPLKLELPPGVVPFRFKLEGYKTVVEKVSIRRGETTQLEVKFEK
jgi:hypothetical protein